MVTDTEIQIRALETQSILTFRRMVTLYEPILNSPHSEGGP